MPAVAVRGKARARPRTGPPGPSGTGRAAPVPAGREQPARSTAARARTRRGLTALLEVTARSESAAPPPRLLARRPRGAAPLLPPRARVDTTALAVRWRCLSDSDVSDNSGLGHHDGLGYCRGSEPRRHPGGRCRRAAQQAPRAATGAAAAVRGGGGGGPGRGGGAGRRVVDAHPGPWLPKSATQRGVAWRSGWGRPSRVSNRRLRPGGEAVSTRHLRSILSICCVRFAAFPLLDPDRRGSLAALSERAVRAITPGYRPKS